MFSCEVKLVLVLATFFYPYACKMGVGGGVFEPVEPYMCMFLAQETRVLFV